MYLFKNALKNVLRHKSRNVMISAMMLAMITCTVLSLVISNTSSAIINDYKDQFSSEVFIQPDIEKLQKEAQENSNGGPTMIRMPTIDSQLLLELASSSYLKEALATASLSLDSSSILAIDENSDSNGMSISPNGGMGTIRFNGGNFSLLGDSWAEFEEGLRALETGSFPTNNNEVLISQELSDVNNLLVGDLFTLESTVQIPLPSDFDVTSVIDGEIIEVNGVNYTVNFTERGTTLSRLHVYEVEVVGIYTDIRDAYENSNMPAMAALNNRNQILTTLDTLLASRYENEQGISIDVTYYLNNPDDLVAFEAEARALGLPETFSVSTDEASYNAIVKPVLGMKSIATTFMFVVIGLGILILLLLTSHAIKERKYEIGVVRAMGMKKSKVALGLWYEMMMITSICLVIGLGIGTAIAQPVSSALLENQLVSIQEPQVQGPQMGGGPQTGGSARPGILTPTPDVTPISEITVKIDAATILQIVLFALFFASISSILSIHQITKYEPMKILMERN